MLKYASNTLFPIVYGYYAIELLNNIIKNNDDVDNAYTYVISFKYL